jgi:hypothetical protein
MRQPWMRVFSILLGCIAFLMPSSAFAGLCEEQLEIPWRSSAVRRIIPLNRPFRLLPDGTEGAGRPNAVVDRPFFNNFQGGGWILFKESQLELFIQTNNQGTIPGCAAVPFIAISIDGKIAPLEPVIHSKPYANTSRLTQEAKDLIRQSIRGPFEIITAINRRFPVGDKTREALKSLYSNDQP